ncbi:MAG: thymidine phosphorylase [Thermoleophilia bacterium]
MSVSHSPLEVLERATRGLPVPPADVRAFVVSWLTGGATDPQMAAWCAVAAARGLDEDAVRALTSALIASGDRLDLAPLGAVGDLHTTGVVGGSAGLVVPPLAAALGVRVAAIADRGRGHVGGAVDSLEAIPGYRARLGLEEFVVQVRDVGCAVVSQTDRLAPGEERLAVLRDQTATMDVPPLIAATVMARAIVGGAKGVVVDVACGDGAFLPNREAAVRAAGLMVRLAEPWDRTVRWVVTSMEAPRGRAVGNALEVREAGRVLSGGGDPDARMVAVALAGELAEAVGAVPAGEGAERAGRALADGTALAAAERWVQAQGGDPSAWTEVAVTPQAPLRLEVPAPRSGVLTAMPARVVGEAVRRLGAGRLHPSQDVDHAVGLEILVGVGEPVTAGDPVAIVHARDEYMGNACVTQIEDCLLIGDRPVESQPAVLLRDTDAT